MKKLFVFVLALLMLCLCACGKIQEAFPEPEDSPEEAPTTPVVTIPNVEKDQAIDPEGLGKVEELPDPAETEPPTSLIDSKYYTLTLPSDWIGKCICDIHERDNGTYSLSVHETKAFFSFGGGTLFTIMMLPTDEDYTIFPSYELLASIDTPDGTYNLVALFPTDVQFDPESEESAANYTAMYETVTDVLYSIAPKDGIEMAMP